MKPQKFITEGIFDVAGKIVAAANQKFNEITGLNTEMYGIKRGGKTWTRGDGVRYKDPAMIHMPELNWLNNNRGEQIKPHFKNDEEKMDLVWDMITSQGQYIGQVSGEFASSEYNDAYKLDGVIFVRRSSFSVSFTTPKVFKNKDIWKKR